MDNYYLEKYNKIIDRKKFKETFEMENTDYNITQMYYLEDGIYIYVCWRYHSFTISKIFKEGKVLYNSDE